MKLILDMNVSPQCAAGLRLAGHEVQHWEDVGDRRSPDEDITAWAKSNRSVVVTHDLDFAHVLALTDADGPSVVQIRAQRMAIPVLTALIAEAVGKCAHQLADGALVTLDVTQRRVRALPLRRD